jgi:pilus assembly protein Flp/PilA
VKEKTMLTRVLKNLWTDEEAPTAVEYAVMVAVIALIVIVGAKALGTAVNTTFTTAAQQVPGG